MDEKAMMAAALQGLQTFATRQPSAMSQPTTSPPPPMNIGINRGGTQRSQPSPAAGNISSPWQGMAGLAQSGIQAAKDKKPHLFSDSGALNWGRALGNGWAPDVVKF